MHTDDTHSYSKRLALAWISGDNYIGLRSNVQMSMNFVLQVTVRKLYLEVVKQAVYQDIQPICLDVVSCTFPIKATLCATAVGP